MVDRVRILVGALGRGGTGINLMTLVKLLKQSVLPVMVRFCDNFCAIFLETL